MGADGCRKWLLFCRRMVAQPGVLPGIGFAQIEHLLTVAAGCERVPPCTQPVLAALGHSGESPGLGKRLAVSSSPGASGTWHVRDKCLDRDSA